MLKKVMNNLILSCKTATELVEKKQVVGLSFFERIRVSSHLFVCKACRSYEKQSLMMEKAIKRMTGSIKTEGYKLDDKAKKKILESLKKS